MSERRAQRQYGKLAEQGRRLASEREDLIAAGADPADLPVPMHPMPPRHGGPIRAISLDPMPSRGEMEGVVRRGHLRELARMWTIVAATCVGALAGCVTAAGTMLVVNQAMTWQTGIVLLAAAGWIILAALAAREARKLRRRARPAPDPTQAA